MDEKVLKKVIKQYVREALTEIFAEMKLETIVESVVSKKVPVVRESVVAKTERLSVKDAIASQYNVPVIKESTQHQPNAAERRQAILEKIGGDSIWKDIYADTANNLEKNDNPNDVESVPTSVLEGLGLMKDYSKHIGMDKKTDEDEEWRKRREQRAKILEQNIKRT